MNREEFLELVNFYKSVFSGAEIDEALGMILNGGIATAVDEARASATKAAGSAADAAQSAVGLDSAVTSANTAANLAAASAALAEYYAEKAHAIAGENVVTSVNGVSPDSVGNVVIDTGGAASVNGVTPDADGNISLDASDVGAIAAGQKGAAGGVATLGTDKKVPAGQLPATMTPSKHAASHKSGGEDPLSADDVGAVSSAGGKMTGNLILPGINILNEAQGRYISAFIGTDGFCYIRNAKQGDSDNRTALYLMPETAEDLRRILRLQKMVDGSATYYNVLGTHNRPSGSYTGSGSATSRTIDVGTSGRTVIIWSNNGVALVSGYGAIVATGRGLGGVSLVEGSAAQVTTSGNLTLATTNTALNANGVTYYYQAL